ncbi:MAG: penicillin-binding protein 2 [Gemmatimonadetes bacterium]|nr:penicillin-binding protein 2 [Gemmatimonadota bacterium]
MSIAFTPFRVRERAGSAIVVIGALFLFLLAAFFRAQVIGTADFRRQSDNNRLRRLILASPRGFILDRNGKQIAENAPGFTVKLVASSRDSLKAVLKRIATLVPGAEEIEGPVVRRYDLASYQPALVFANASIETVAILEEHRYQLPGLVIRTEPRRLYGAGQAVAHLVGYAGEVSDDELTRGRFPGARPGTIVGKDGLEAKFDSVVRGLEGESFIEVDARGRMVRDESESQALKPVTGEMIRTTIDLELQTYIDSLWSADRVGVRGAMVVMTPDGQVLALYSAPTFDPNELITGVSSRRWAQLNGEAKPLQNRAIRGSFPPGSPFKLVTAAVALKRGVVDFSSRMPQPCTGGYRFGNRVFHCWKKSGHGSLDLTGAIASSCNIYFYQLGLRIGLPNLLAEATTMGLSSPTGIDLASERSSSFPPSTAYYDRLYGARGWSNAVTLNLSIGQGENAQTLMGLTRFYAALASDGTVPIPYVVEKPTGSRRSLGLTPEQLAGLRTALVAVVDRGTAAASGGRDLRVAGKTGTAQNPQGPDHGWFIAFAPAEKPTVVVGSLMEFALHGTAVAPYVVKVIRRYLEKTDPTLAKARTKMVIQEDSATAVSELIADSAAPPPPR